MTISGQFRDYRNRLCEVTITTQASGSNITIGGDIVKFARDPVIIDTTNDDTFNVLIRRSATINLVTTQYIGDLLFASNARSSSVTIKRGSATVFTGYVDPGTFNQPWTSPLDTFSITCIDKLSTLQYYTYKEITPTTFEAAKRAADNVTFKSILDDALSGLSFTYILYDKSKGVSSSTLSTVFNDLTVSELKFIGESADDTWTREDTLTEILKYLNLHAYQEGNVLYIFDWDSIKTGVTSWYNLMTSSNRTVSAASYTLTNSSHADRGTNVSIADVYNQIVVNCDVDAQDTVIESPLDKSSITSFFTGKQLYMTEYYAEGSGDTANDAINNLILGQSTDYEKSGEIDWYMQVMSNPNWKFYTNPSNSTTIESTFDQSNGIYTNQWKVAKYLKENSCVPAILQLGSVEHQASANTTKKTSKIDMKNYLYISVNGNEWDTTARMTPTENTIQSHSGMCEFVSNVAGGSFSPLDDATTNYLVFKGKILLQPIVYESTTTYAQTGNYYEAVRTATGHINKTEGEHHTAKAPLYNIGRDFDALDPDGYASLPSAYKSNLAKSENNDEGRYYSRKFYTFAKPTDTKEQYPNQYVKTNTPFIQPWTKDKSAKGYQYNYSKTGATGTADRYLKLPILECELIIGNKRLVETNMDQYGNSTFAWYEIGQEPTIDGETKTTFSLGVDPDIGDFIIGQEYDIQNTIDYTMNISEEGTAIPIKKSDAVSGQVHFKILGPINTTWDDITRRHPSFWRHTSWTTNTRSILAHTEAIIIQDFECVICSNNGLNETTKDNDLVYMSDETQNYISKKDDIDFKLMTQLTSQEALDKGITQSVPLNAVIRTSTGLPISGIYNKYESDSSHKTAKAEEHYINQYYLEYSSPKLIMDTLLHDDVGTWNTRYTSTVLGKTFISLAKTDNMRECTTNYTLKEI